MIIGKPYVEPPPKFQSGDTVKFCKFSDDSDYEPGVHTVRTSDHCFAWIVGRRFGIPNYRLKRVGKKQNSTSV